MKLTATQREAWDIEQGLNRKQGHQRLREVGRLVRDDPGRLPDATAKRNRGTAKTAPA